MLYLIYRKVLIVLTNTGIVTRPCIRVVMPLGTSLTISVGDHGGFDGGGGRH